MTWKLRYASHLGYRSPDTPLFRASVGSLDPVAHIEFAASLGFSGVQYALAVTRPRDEQNAVADALRRLDLEAGCLLYASVEKVRQPLWGAGGRDQRALLLAELTGSIETAKRVGTRYVALLSGADPRQPLSLQHAALIENLKWAADLAAQAGVILCLESIGRRSLPDMLLHHIGETYAIVKAVDSPAVRLIFDTSHVQIMDGDIITNLEATYDAIALVQIADNPSRLEPGSGELNFPNILRVLKNRGFAGLVELEHGWSQPTRATEERGIAWLRKMDAEL